MEEATPAGPATAGTIELAHPIMVDGAERSSIPWDLEKITTAQFMAAEVGSKKEGYYAAGTAEMDYSFHLHLGFQAAIACDGSLDIEDLKRVRGGDIRKFMRVGRFFTNALEESDQGKSEGPRDSSRECSRPQSPQSTDGPSPASSPSTGKH